MIIEINGAGFVNKGAELMLATVCDRLRREIPGVRLAMPAHHGFDFEQRARYNLEMVVRPPGYSNSRTVKAMLQDGLLVGLANTPLSRMIGLVPVDEVGALIDISGYGFGDKWPAATTRRFARRASVLKQQGKPVIMLPQMLGPFTVTGQADAFRRLTQSVDLIYARDQESLKYAQVLDMGGVMRISPDITIPTRPVRTADVTEEYGCIVPNSRLLENNSYQDWGNRYMPRLETAARHLARRDLSVKIVQHEYHLGDSRVVDALQRSIGSDRCEVVRSTDPMVLKSVLGGAQIVVGSRFHALVSSLSMGTPAIALGWAHKYDALLQDFGLPELLDHAEHSNDHIQDLIDQVIDNRATLHRVVMENTTRLTGMIESMWDEVFTSLGRPLGQEQSESVHRVTHVNNIG